MASTPAEVDAGIKRIKELTVDYGREGEIEEDHYGALFSFCFADDASKARKMAEPYMLRRRTDVDYDEFSAFGPPEDVRGLIDRYIEAGATKFVARPACAPEHMQRQLEILGREIVPRYHKARVAS